MAESNSADKKGESKTYVLAPDSELGIAPRKNARASQLPSHGFRV